MITKRAIPEGIALLVMITKRAIPEGIAHFHAIIEQ